MPSDNVKQPHTVIATWRIDHGTPRLESTESLEGHPWLRVVAVEPKREDLSCPQALGDLVGHLKDIERFFLPNLIVPKVNVIRIREPDGEPLVFKGSGAVPRGEAITALLCEPDAAHGHVMHEPRYNFAGLDVLLVVWPKGAPDDLWRAGVEHILATGATQARVLFVDRKRASLGP